MQLSVNTAWNKSLYDPADPLIPEPQVDATEALQSGIRLQFTYTFNSHIEADMFLRGDRVRYMNWTYDHDILATGFSTRFTLPEGLQITIGTEIAHLDFSQEGSRGSFGLPLPGVLLEMRRWRTDLEISKIERTLSPNLTLQYGLNLYHLRQREQIGAWHGFDRAGGGIFALLTHGSWKFDFESGFFHQSYLNRRFSLQSSATQHQKHQHHTVVVRRKFGNWSADLGFEWRRFKSNNQRLSYIAREYRLGIEYPF